MIYIQLLESMSLIALSAYIYNQTHFFKNLIKDRFNFWDKCLLVVFFSILGIIGNYTGVNIRPYNAINDSMGLKYGYIGLHDAIANTRPIAIITAGYIGGPITGMLVGAICGIHRYFLGGFTAFSCAIATLFEGIVGSCARKYSKDSDFNIKDIFIGAIIAEIVQMIVILMFAKPFYVSLKLVEIIAVPMMLINSFGCAIFINIVKNAREEYNKISAIQAQKALNIAQNTVSYLRKGLNTKTSGDVCNIIYKMSNADGVFIGDKNGILSYCGMELGKNLFGPEMKDYYNNPSCKVIQIPSKRRILYFLCSPFYIDNSGFQGVLGIGVKSEKDLTIYFKQFVKELSGLLSTQIELYKLNKLAQEASMAKFRALRAQIEPHFLFNALNTIASFCRTNPIKARELIMDLSNNFRQTLRREKEFVFLKDEIEFVSSYFSIEKARFGDRLKLIVDIPDIYMESKIPSFVIQPIIENAIKHGILPKEEGGTIILKAVPKKGNTHEVLFLIEDTGVGIEEDKLRKLFKDSSGIGLKNVDQRLKLLYGEKYGIHIETSLNMGTKVSFVIPVKEACVLDNV